MVPVGTVRTLVVDDDPVIRRMISRCLVEAGHTVIEAGDGREGLERFAAEQPDLVLLDLNMPVMGGLEVLGRVTRQSPETPVVVVSGAGGFDEAVEALRLGAWDYLTKPIGDPSVLGHTVNKALERARLLRENREHQLFLEQEVRRRTLELEQSNQDLLRTQQQLWEQLEQAQKMEAMGMLAGGIAHDFNNILGTILVSAEMVIEGKPADTAEHADLERIVRVSQRGKSLVQRILSFTRTPSRSSRTLQVSAVVEEIVQFLRAILPSSIELAIDIDPDAGTIESDPVQIQQIVMNLITNAVHALKDTPDPRLSVRVRPCLGGKGKGKSAERTAGWVEITVGDNGHGIRAEDLERIFTPRFTTKGQDEGSGLGLFVVKELVNRRKGKIGVRSEPGKGAEFSIVLPLHEEQQPRRKSRKGRATSAPRGVETILVADDDEELSESLRRMLSSLGYRVVLAGDGQEALVRLERMPGSIHLALIDQDMPRMSGTAVCRELMERAPGLPILLMTGRLEESVHSLMQTANVRDVLFKPVGKERIAAAIRSILDTGRGDRIARPGQEDREESDQAENA
jgi:CheY-like chemotaxis protein